MIKRIVVFLDDNNNILYSVPRNEDLRFKKINLDSIVDEFISDITKRGWVSDQSQTEIVTSLKFSEENLMGCAYQLWGYYIKNKS